MCFRFLFWFCCWGSCLVVGCVVAVIALMLREMWIFFDDFDGTLYFGARRSPFFFLPLAEVFGEALG